MRKPRPLAGNNPGYRDTPPPGLSGDHNREPGVVRAARGVASDLEKMGHSLKKSAGHAAHDILHGIGL
jgi:hypothetical protein